MKAGDDTDKSHGNGAKTNMPLRGCSYTSSFVVPVLQDRSKWRQTGKTKGGRKRGGWRRDDEKHPKTAKPSQRITLKG